MATKKKTVARKAKPQKFPKLSYDTQTLLTVLLLVTIYPVGLVLMFRWMKWPTWLKVLILSPVILLVGLSFIVILLLSLVRYS